MPACPRVTRRATRTASTPSSPTSTPRSAASTPRVCRPSTTAAGPPSSPTPSSGRPLTRPGWRYPHEARLPDRLPAGPAALGDRPLGARARVRGAGGGGVAGPRRPAVHGDAPARRVVHGRRRRERQQAVLRQRDHAVVLG